MGGIKMAGIDKVPGDPKIISTYINPIVPFLNPGIGPEPIFDPGDTVIFESPLKVKNKPDFETGQPSLSNIKAKEVDREAKNDRVSGEPGPGTESVPVIMPAYIVNTSMTGFVEYTEKINEPKDGQSLPVELSGGGSFSNNDFIVRDSI
jgi:hypothetical protein